MTAKEALGLTNKAREEKRMERRPALDEVMPRIYADIKDSAASGSDFTYLSTYYIPENLVADVEEELLKNGFKVVVSYGLDLFIEVRW